MIKFRKKVIGYVRVSTEEQKKHGNSMEIQIDRIRNYCLGMGWELVEIVEEPAESGSSMAKRKKLQSIISRLGNGDFEAIVAIKLDRIARNLKELLILHDDILEPKGCGLVSLDDQFDTGTPQGRLFFQIIGGFAEFERSLITGRTMEGITSKAEKGQHASGRIAMGYKSVMVDGKKSIEIVESEKEIVELIFRLKDENYMSFQKIADYLNANGYKPKNWKPEKPVQFHNSSVQVIYKNPKYKGIYTFNRRGEDQIVVENEAIRILS
jgi:site-specific DNA recombinase